MTDTSLGAEFGTDASGLTVPTVEDQARVIAAHMTATETATLALQIETLQAENAALQTQRDVALSSLEVATAALAAAETAAAELAAATARHAELAELATVRSAVIRELAPSLLDGDDAAARIERWAGMESATFDAFVADLRAVAGASAAGFSAATAETAAVTARTSATSVDDNPAAALMKGI